METAADSMILTPESLAAMIDHTFLRAYGTPEEIETLCREASEYRFAMVAVNPAEVARCVKLLAGSGVRVGAAVGFPLGQNTSQTKAFETRDALEKGELDERRCCKTLTYCTYLMRQKNHPLGQFPTGCPPFDKEGYGEVIKLARHAARGE